MILLNDNWQFWWLSWTSISRDSTAPAELSLRHLRFEFSRIARTLHDDHCDSPVHKCVFYDFYYFSISLLLFYYSSIMYHHCSHAAGKPLGLSGTRAMFMMFEEKEKILKIPQNINSGDEMNIFLPKLMKKGRVQLFNWGFCCSCFHWPSLHHIWMSMIKL